MNTANWSVLARGLAGELADEGVLRSDAWREAVEAVPRHVFVSRFYTQQPDGEWVETGADDPGWLPAVYRNQPLVTDLAVDSRGNRVTVSSSTKPGLMVRTLEALDVRDGQRVLEIGTGTGYNAGLLSHRLGDDRVFSVDIGAGLVAAARGRLAGLGFTPVLSAAHGADGMPGHAPFDRIIATCSVPSVPWAWAEQVREGGLVLVDVKRSGHAGNLVLLRRHPDRLEGRFLARWAGFMAMRDVDQAPESGVAVAEVASGERSVTQLDPLPWSAQIPWFLAHAHLPGDLAFGYHGTSAVFTAHDGSRAAVQTGPGEREVRQHGPTRIWDAFEAAHQAWDALGKPAWDRFGMTVTAEGGQRVWLDDPADGPQWRFPDRSAQSTSARISSDVTFTGEPK
ncbi:methyltransferase domain-containing protein [Actinokineospora sp. 24-640]